MQPLNYRQRMFVAYYLGESSGSAADAARKAGYKWPETQGPRLLKTSEIRAAIAARVETAAISADEVLARLSDTATSDLMHFIELDSTGEWKVDLKGINEAFCGREVGGSLAPVLATLRTLKGLKVLTEAVNLVVVSTFELNQQFWSTSPLPVSW